MALAACGSFCDALISLKNFDIILLERKEGIIMTYDIDKIYDTLLRHIDFSRMHNEPFNDANAEEFFNRDDIDLDWDYKSGATKAVFIPDDPNAQFVIKIPFNSDYETWRDEETGEFNWFEYAWYPGSDHSGWDYCQAEMEMYEEAAMVGLRDFFAETSLLTHCDGWPVYISERCDFGMDRSRSNDKSREEAERLIKEEHIYELTFDFMQNLVAEYSRLQIYELVEFIREHHINDLRDANWGYVREYDYRPVITDYSGYNEDCW